jgi:putative acyl-CoA dehydrogenase
MCDAFLVLAQAPGGLSCFFLPRWTPDGAKNAFHLQRLKPKLGNRSNASSEVEFDGAWARMFGDEGRGVATILEMVHHTRLDCVMGSAALMRRALVEAVHHTRHRSAFGKLLIDQPAMQSVLADLAIESEAATLLLLRLARAFDENDRPFGRLGVAVGKYWVAKRTAVHVAEALECLGGNGFVEESPMPRLYREAPLNSIWEGSGNVIALDVLRTIAKEPGALDAMFSEIRACRDARVITAAAAIETRIHAGVDERDARSIAESIAIALEASLTVRHSPPALSAAFCSTRLAGEGGRTFGTLPRSADVQAIIRALDVVV